MEKVPVPTPSDNEVLIKTKKTSICGTDVHIYKWDALTQDDPIFRWLLDTYMGEIAQVGRRPSPDWK